MNQTLLKFQMPVFNIPFILTRLGALSFVLMATGLGIIAYFVVDITVGEAVIAGLLGLLSHILTDLIHQYGHYRAGAKAGYPMNRLWTFSFIILGLYPEDEPELSPEIHIQRAWGGPIANAIHIVVVALLTALLWEQGGLVRFVLGYTLLETVSLLIVSLFPPLEIGAMTNDGMIIKRYRAILKEQQGS